MADTAFSAVPAAGQALSGSDLALISQLVAGLPKTRRVTLTQLKALFDGSGLSIDLEFNQHQALQFVIQNLTSDPSSPVDGQIWLRTDL
jgi:hypothetical protein